MKKEEARSVQYAKHSSNNLYISSRNSAVQVRVEGLHVLH